MDRKHFGQQNLGMPCMMVLQGLAKVVMSKDWPDFRREAVDYYFDRMIGHWLLELLDNALDDEQIQAVAPIDVGVLAFRLFRDMFRHDWAVIRPETRDADWVEPLFEEIRAHLELPAASVLDDGRPYELRDIEQCEWAEQLAAPFGIMPQKLFVSHAAIVTGVVEELGSRGAHHVRPQE